MRINLLIYILYIATDMDKVLILVLVHKQNHVWIVGNSIRSERP